MPLRLLGREAQDRPKARNQVNRLHGIVVDYPFPHAGAAKHKKIIMAHGASVHGLQALRAFPGTRWLDISMIRMNHNGTRMDTESMRDVPEQGNVNEVVANARKVHEQGSGVISMKLVGEGRFTRPEDRDAAIRFAFNEVPVDCVTIGFKNTQEIDEAIDRFQRVLNA